VATVPQPSSFSQEPQPAWDVARLFPAQGDWSEADYLSLHTNQLVELIDGTLEVLPMPTPPHQLIVAYLYDRLKAFAAAGKLGTVFFAPLRVRVRPNAIREPDVVFVARQHAKQIGSAFCDGADLVIEVVSPDAASHERDYEKKRADYALAGIAEYWIVDPQTQRITVLELFKKQYRLFGEFSSGQQATSQLLAGFAVDTSAVFEAAKNLD
jgi:Uma2 family endonuclease